VNALIHARELFSLKGKVRLIDARWGENPQDHYRERHLEGALYADLESELSHIREDLSQGGRHPLPSPAEFARVLGRLGIDPDTHVVVYDDRSGAAAAARFWWMLRGAGHVKVQVLDGGLKAALRLGFPAASGTEAAPDMTPYPLDRWQLPIADMDEVGRLAAGSGCVVDVREAERYRGETEPYDLVAGHIPGAINIPYMQNLGEDGHFLPAMQLRSLYGDLFSGHSIHQIAVHCGSGVTACHTLLAMEVAGLGIPALYPGSYSEWSRNQKPINTSSSGNR
jgi:thiosulfate/3-mercaptopyruvate sulfurtransferase